MLDHDIRPGVGASGSLEAGAMAELGGVAMRSIYKVECFDAAGALKWVEEVPNIVNTVGLNHLLSRVIKGQSAALPGYADGRRLPPAWATATAYAIGDVVRPVTPGSNNRLYICEIAGTSHATTEPTWPTADSGTVVDNTVTWREASRWFVGLKNTGTPVAGDTMASHASWTENTTYSETARPALVPGAVASGSVDNSASKAAFSINGTTTIFGAFLTDIATKSGTAGVLYGVADFAASRAVISGDTLNVTVTLTAATA
jgi:hypothetical protein